MPHSELPAQTTTLDVIIENKAPSIASPGTLPQSVADSHGKAKIGVQKSNTFSPEKFTVIAHDELAPPSKTHKARIEEKILSIDKPSTLIIPESKPELLVTKEPIPDAPEEPEAPAAPAPSVEHIANSDKTAIEKLVSVEPLQGDEPQKIAIAETALEKVTDIESGNKLTTSTDIKPEQSQPEKVIIPELVKPEFTKLDIPIIAETPRPPEPRQLDIPQPKVQPLKPAIPEPVKIEPAVLREIKKLEIARTDTAKLPKLEKQGTGKTIINPNIPPSTGVKSDIFRKDWHGIESPGLLEFGIVSDGRFTEHKISKNKFGERVKNVNLQERDIRYAMYIEGIRLKLERIGNFNYPAEAARNNLSGSLSITLSIRPDGSLEDFSISQPSIHESLNTGVERIVRMAAPFSPFSDSIRKDTDILTINVNWTFSNSQQTLY